MRQMQSLAILGLLVALPMCLFSHPAIRVREIERYAECHGCNNECDQCEYGVVISPKCGVLQCRKGPDEHCGGHSNAVCGDGMRCMCERCIGCSIDTLKCSNPELEHPCLPNRNFLDANALVNSERTSSRFTLMK